MPKPNVLGIVTPSFNSEAFIDDTIRSVINQTGRLKIVYHVQDGGSTDGTLAIVREWQKRIAEGYPLPNDGVDLTFSSERDGGVYDAVTKGFERVLTSETQLMTWINSDDLLAPSAAASAFAVIRDLPSVSWLTGRSILINEAGATTTIFGELNYSRRLLAEGYYNGRGRSVVQQEGTFWRPWLWNCTGGLDLSFKLAGDWDLWRRFALSSGLTWCDTLMGFHRKRAGQLSEDMASYWREIDAKVAAAGPIDKDAGFADEVPQARWSAARERWEAGGFHAPAVVPQEEAPPKRHGVVRRLNHKRINWLRKIKGKEPLGAAQ